MVTEEKKPPDAACIRGLLVISRVVRRKCKLQREPQPAASGSEI